MNIPDPLTQDVLQQQMAQLLEANRADLVSQYLRVLRETQFINRAEVRPNMLKGLAEEEFKALFGFLSQPAFSSIDYGTHLYQIGLSEQVILRLGQTTRLFFLPVLASDQIALMLVMVDRFQAGVFKGFMRNLEKSIYREQELSHKAVQRAFGQD